MTRGKGRQAMPGGLTHTVFAALEHHPEGLTVAQITDGTPYTTSSARVICCQGVKQGTVARVHAAAGHHDQTLYAITPAGLARLASLREQDKRREQETRVARALADVATREPMTRDETVAAARYLAKAGASTSQVARLTTTKAARTAIADLPRAKPGPRRPFDPADHLPLIGDLSDETGLTTDEIMGLLTIMRAMGIIIDVPPAWRNETRRLSVADSEGGQQ